jgi:hypothetical protein
MAGKVATRFEQGADGGYLPGFLQAGSKRKFAIRFAACREKNEKFIVSFGFLWYNFHKKKQ